MTTVHIDLRQPNGEEVTGSLEWTPTRRRHVDGPGPAPDPGDYIVLPGKVVVDLTRARVTDGEGVEVWAGVADVDLEPDDGVTWAWRVRERTSPRGLSRYVHVPDADVVDYGDLVVLDPETLEPSAEPEAAWWAALTDAVATIPDGADIDAAVAAYLAAHPAGVEMRVDAGQVQYRPAADGPWQDLIAVESLRGEPGPQGDRGPQGYSVALRRAITSIQWRIDDGSPTGGWSSLIPIADITGPAGDPGAPGGPGPSAYEVAVAAGFVGDEAAWLASLVGPPGADGDDGTPGAPGDPGPATEWRTTATHLQARPVGGSTWTDVTPLSAITGPPGADGAPGTTSWDGLTDMPTVVAAGDTLAEARAALGIYVVAPGDPVGTDPNGIYLTRVPA